MTPRLHARRAGVAAALAMAPFAVAWRFAHAYRARAGFPRVHPPVHDPSALGLPFEPIVVPSGELRLPGWWIPARGGAPGPAIALVHGWESACDRLLPQAIFLHAAGFHVLAFDIRGHGDNPPEALPLSAGEFGADALAGVQFLLDRTDVTAVGVLGHSMGSIGALLAAAAEPRVAAVIATATPADPYRLTRQTFRLARLPLPDAVAYPLAWLTTRVFLQPRGHDVGSISASGAIERYRGPVLLVHGDADLIVPPSHMERLARRARQVRREDPRAPVEVLSLPGGQHSWLYESPAYRATVARFLTTWLGGPLDPETAAANAAAIEATRLPDAVRRFSVLDDEPGGLRTLLRAVGRGGLARPPTIEVGLDDGSGTL